MEQDFNKNTKAIRWFICGLLIITAAVAVFGLVWKPTPKPIAVAPKETPVSLHYIDKAIREASEAKDERTKAAAFWPIVRKHPTPATTTSDDPPIYLSTYIAMSPDGWSNVTARRDKEPKAPESTIRYEAFARAYSIPWFPIKSVTASVFANAESGVHGLLEWKFEEKHTESDVTFTASFRLASK